MASLSIKRDQNNCFITVASPIVFTSSRCTGAGYDEISFEILEADAACLIGLMNKAEIYLIDGEEMFFGTLESLERAQSTHPSLGLLRAKSTLKGIMQARYLEDAKQ